MPTKKRTTKSKPTRAPKPEVAIEKGRELIKAGIAMLAAGTAAAHDRDTPNHAGAAVFALDVIPPDAALDAIEFHVARQRPFAFGVEPIPGLAERLAQIAKLCRPPEPEKVEGFNPHKAPPGTGTNGEPPIPFVFSPRDRVQLDAQTAAANPNHAGDVLLIAKVGDGAAEVRFGSWSHYGDPDRELFTVAGTLVPSLAHLRPASIGTDYPPEHDAFGEPREVWAYAVGPRSQVPAGEFPAPSNDHASGCAICGRPVEHGREAAIAVIGDGGSKWASPYLRSTDPGSLGVWPVGADCHAKHAPNGVRIA